MTSRNSNRRSLVWLLDLDNTLHNASRQIMPIINSKMNDFIDRLLVDTGTGMTADELRRTYWRKYGATLQGLTMHHEVSASEFLETTHDIAELRTMIEAERALSASIKRLPGRKILFSNAPARYVGEVVRYLGIHRDLTEKISIENMWIHRRLRPKPSQLLLRKTLRAKKLPSRHCILVDDTLANLKTAKRLGIRTVWFTRYLSTGQQHLSASVNTFGKPRYVDVKIRSVHRLCKL